MVHEWRHFCMMKRAGHGHEPGGVLATLQGECALLCPACPQLGINTNPNITFKDVYINSLRAAEDY